MNNLINRDYHEAIGRVVKIEINNDLQLGNSLLPRIPFNMIGEMENQKIEKIDDDKPIALSDNELEQLIPRLNFNLPECNFKLMEKKFIDENDYWNMYELLNTYDSYKNMGKFAVYVYSRELCNCPIEDNEYKKINNDIRTLNKCMKQLKNKNDKRSNQKKNKNK